jgi:hypothetical protein
MEKVTYTAVCGRPEAVRRLQILLRIKKSVFLHRFQKCKLA